MKAVMTAVYGTAMVVLVSGLAETRTPYRPSPEALHPETLARTEAITSYCEQADPGDASHYASRLVALVHGHTEGEIQRERQTANYQHALAQARETLATASPGRAVQACTEYLAEQ